MSEPETPLLTQKLVGYRCWRTGGLLLKPRVHRLPAWSSGTNRAGCLHELVGRRWVSAKLPHAIPGHKCNCGLYAYRDLATLLYMEVPEWTHERELLAGMSGGPPARIPVKQMRTGGNGWVLGAVVAWGRVEAHNDGFRAELMAPVALTHHPDATPSAVAKARALARGQGLRYVLFDELEEFASGYGAPLPEQLRPGRGPAPAGERLVQLRLEVANKRLQAVQQRIAKEQLEALRKMTT